MSTLSPLLIRTSLLLGEDPLLRLATKHAVIAGCGGVGGATALTLARLGIGRFTVIDPGAFDEPDTNRQWGAFHSTLGKNKAAVTRDQILDINPAASVRIVEYGVTESNAPEFVNGADLLIDAVDVSVHPSVRWHLHQAAWERNIPAIVAPIVGFGALVAVSTPGSLPLHEFGTVLVRAVTSSRIPPRLQDVFAAEHLVAVSQSLLKSRVPPSYPASPALAASISATEALYALSDRSLPGWRPPQCLPHVIAIDLARLKVELVHLDDLRGTS